MGKGEAWQPQPPVPDRDEVPSWHGEGELLRFAHHPLASGGGVLTVGTERSTAACFMQRSRRPWGQLIPPEGQPDFLGGGTTGQRKHRSPPPFRLGLNLSGGVTERFLRQSATVPPPPMASTPTLWSPVPQARLLSLPRQLCSSGRCSSPSPPGLQAALESGLPRCQAAPPRAKAAWCCQLPTWQSRAGSCPEKPQLPAVRALCHTHSPRARQRVRAEAAC